MAKDDKLKALDAAIAQIERQYGKGSVMKLGDNSANMNVETDSYRIPQSGYCIGTRRTSERTYH